MTLSPRRLFAAILFISLFVMATREITDPDFYWHLRTGQFIVESHTIPHNDIFSYTNTDKPWVAHEWLAEMLMYVLYHLGSFPALTITFSAFIAIAFGIAFARSPGKPYVAGLSVLLSALASAPTWGVRPQIFSLLLSSIFLGVLEYKSRDGQRPLLWILVPLTILWVNLHGGFALGITLVGVYLAGEVVQDLVSSHRIHPTSPQVRALAVTLAACLAAVLLNPNGARMYIYPFETLGSSSIQTYIQEWFSPDFHLVEFQPFAWLMLATVGAIGLSGKRITITQAILLVGLGYASLMSARQIPIFALIAGPILSEHIWEHLHDRRWNASEGSGLISRPFALLNWSLLILVLTASVVRIATVLGNQQAAVESKLPIKAVEFIRSSGTGLPLYNAYPWGGYLIWRMYPEQLVFIDGRSDLYGEKFIGEYLQAWKGDPGWQNTLDAYRVQIVLIEPDAPLANRLGQDPSWKQVFRDSLALVFQRQ